MMHSITKFWRGTHPQRCVRHTQPKRPSRPHLALIRVGAARALTAFLLSLEGAKSRIQDLERVE